VAENLYPHRTVLLDEAVDGLAIDGARRDGFYIDGTFGRGGHSRAIVARLSPLGQLLAFDRDPAAVASAAGLDHANFTIVHSPFTSMRDEVHMRKRSSVDGILLDLGISSPQIDDAGRGFSFRHDGPLDMRMDPTRGVSAAEWLDTASADDIERVIRDHGEERFAFQIAQAIVARRAERPLSRTRELAELVAAVIPRRRLGKSRADATQDPATRTFQAIRIHVNQELEELAEGLSQAMDLLAPGGRLAVIAFHSLEDRIVKRFIARQADPDATADAVSRRLPLRHADLPKPALESIARVRPSDAEVAANPRARSAVLRIAERTNAPRVPAVSDRGVRR
jgi:16S rRNA (cytosine1402-N4)-methyltransferase